MDASLLELLARADTRTLNYRNSSSSCVWSSPNTVFILFCDRCCTLTAGFNRARCLRHASLAACFARTARQQHRTSAATRTACLRRCGYGGMRRAAPYMRAVAPHDSRSGYRNALIVRSRARRSPGGTFFVIALGLRQVLQRKSALPRCKRGMLARALAKHACCARQHAALSPHITCGRFASPHRRSTIFVTLISRSLRYKRIS